MTVVLVVHLMIVLVLIGTVLLQKSEGGGLGMGGGAGFMSSRGTANLLTRTTAVLAVGFFATSLLLSWIASYDRKPSSLITGQPPGQSQPAAPGSGGVLDTLKKSDQQSQNGGATPVAPPTSGGLLDTLRKADEQQNQQQNQTPSAPEAPRSQ
jgi:preprotein translocase subunit SecG